MNQMQTYWDDRYAKQKELTVGHCSFSKKRFDAVTKNSHKLINEHFSEYLDGKRILDFGCGVGRHTGLLKGLSGNKGEVFGTDINKWAVEKARNDNPTCETSLLEGQKTSYRSKFFDIIFAWTVLQHIPDQEIEDTIREFDRILKYNGKILIYENTTNKKSNNHIWFRSVQTYSLIMTHHALMWRGKTIVIPDIDGTGEEHTIMVFFRSTE